MSGEGPSLFAPTDALRSGRRNYLFSGNENARRDVAVLYMLVAPWRNKALMASTI